MRIRHSRRGLTLIEILASLAISVVVAVIVVRSLSATAPGGPDVLAEGVLKVTDLDYRQGQWQSVEYEANGFRYLILRNYDRNNQAMVVLEKQPIK